MGHHHRHSFKIAAASASDSSVAKTANTHANAAVDAHSFVLLQSISTSTAISRTFSPFARPEISRRVRSISSSSLRAYCSSLLSRYSWLPYSRILSSIGLRTSDGSGPGEAVERGARHLTRACPLSAATGRTQAPDGRSTRDSDLAGAFGLRPLSGALALALALAGCEADHVGAKDALLEWGYTGIGIETGPMFDRPCRAGQPYAVRFTAHDAAGKPAAGWVCASDEFAHDGLIFLDREAS